MKIHELVRNNNKRIILGEFKFNVVRRSSAIIWPNSQTHPLQPVAHFRSPNFSFYCQHSARSGGTSTYVALGNHDGAEI